jgi:hypothetical protein
MWRYWFASGAADSSSGSSNGGSELSPDQFILVDDGVDYIGLLDKEHKVWSFSPFPLLLNVCQRWAELDCFFVLLLSLSVREAFGGALVWPRRPHLLP